MEQSKFKSNFKNAEICENRGNNAESIRIRKSSTKLHFRKRTSKTKFHFKIRKPYFKLRKAFFKRGLERNCKNKNVLEFDVEKDVGIIFCLFLRKPF